MDIKKITKKEFISFLTSPDGAGFLGVCMYAGATTPPREIVVKTDKALKAESVWRVVKAKQTNCLIWSDGSRLYFDSFADRTYWKANAGTETIVWMDARERGSDLTKRMVYVVES